MALRIFSDHCIEVHGGTKGPNEGSDDFIPVVYSSFRDPLSRILDEGVRIKAVVDDDTLDCLNTMMTYYKAEYVRLRADKGLLSQLGIRQTDRRNQASR